MGRFDINTMLKQNGGPVTISSLLIPFFAIKPETIDAIRNATIVGAVNKASELWGPEQALTCRDLFGVEMGYPVPGDMVETSNAALGWQAMAFGAFQVPVATVIGIYGVILGFAYGAAIFRLPITGIRFDVGGSRVAQWNVQTLDTGYSTAAMTDALQPQGGVTKSPIIVAEDITVTIFEYVRTAATIYNPVWLGVTVEKQGVTLKP